MTKKLFYRYFTLFMTVLVLTSSIGVHMVEKVCLTRGKSVVNLAYKEKDEHCKLCKHASKPEKSTSQTPVFKKLQCCLESHQLKNVDVQVLSGKKTESSQDQDEQPVENVSILFRPLTISVSALVSPIPISFSSLFFGRSMLTFVRVLRI